MASNTAMLPKLLRNLKDHGKPLLQCGALTYVRSNAEKMETSNTLTEKNYKEICRLVMDILCNDDHNMKNEDTKTLQAVLKYFKKHALKFFESALQISRDKRPKIFEFLRSVEDSELVTAALDSSTINFIVDCLQSIDPNKMEWLLPTSCTDNLQKLVQAENKPLSDNEELEELLVCNTIALLQRFYKLAAATADIQSIQKFDTLVMDKVVLLAYMGHKRQRGPALSLLNQAIESDLGMRMKMIHTDAWTKYMGNLQGPYTGRMSLLVKACELDWSNQWSISIQLLGTELHRGATLINNLLSVEERAFKSTDTMVRRQAFVSWKLLIDNFALDVKELATPRRIKLLCVPLTAKNSKSEMIALTKLDVWWYLITKLYYHITKFADPVVTQFLNFCFGPLGDTPLLSTKFDVIASPVKRFYKTKIVAIAALHQLLVRQEDRKAFGSVLTEELPNSVSETLFVECYKVFLHSVGEAIVMISQLHDSEMRNREVICQVLWRHLMHYIQSANDESKKNIYNELILVVMELKNRASSVPFINSFIRDVIMDELATVAKDLVYHDKRLIDLVTKIMVPSFLKFLQTKHCDSLKSLIWQTVRPETSNDYHPETLRFLESTLQQLRSVPIDPDASIDCFELWFVYADIISKYMKTLHSVNEGTTNEPNFKTLKSIISFPFTHMYWVNSIQAQRIALHWKEVYKKFECQADLISSIKPNEILDDTSKTIEHCLATNDKCHRIAVYCLDALLSTINYKFLLAQNKIPPLVRLIGDITTIALHEGRPTEAECALRALSSLLITVYGHNPDKALAYMKATSQTIELMLKTDADDTLAKEIASTWETIVSIVRGLNSLLDHTLLVSYKQVISLALRHTNPAISSQAQSILEMKDSVRESARAVLAELAQEWTKSSTKKDTPKTKLDKVDRTPKQTKIAGSFLTRAIQSPRLGSGKAKEKEEKKVAPPPPEPDSQDYVLIKSEVKVDVSRLTEHQKESLKRRRDDIPAMYNDLSQSSSQNTQDLQQWFDSKKKRNEPTKILPESEKSLMADEDPNKENKIDTIVPARDEKLIEEPVLTTNTPAPKDLEDKCSPDVPTPEIHVSSGQDPDSDLTIAELSKSNQISPKSSEKENKELQTNKSNTTPNSDSSYVPGTNSPEVSPSNPETPIVTVVKQLNFESRDEYPDEKNAGEDTTSTSNSATPTLRNGKVAGNATPDEKSSPLQESPTVSAKGKPGRPKGRAGKASASIPQRVSKRKLVSGTDTDDSDRDKKRTKLETPDNTESNVASTADKRYKMQEINRLRIDMVFDGPQPQPRRRSKYKDDVVSGDATGKQQCSPEVVATRGKIVDARKGVPETDKKETGSSDVTTKRRRRSIKTDAEAKTGTQEPEETQTIAVKNVRKSTSKIKKSLKESGVSSESQIIVDDEESMKLHETSTPNDEKDKSASQSSSIDTRKKSDVECTETPTQNDLDDVVESSQECSSLVGSHRRPLAKVCSPITNNDPKSSTEPAELPVGKKQPLASSPLNSSDPPNVPTTDNNEKVAGDDPDETFLDISAIRPQLADDVPTDDAEKKAPEASKTSANPAIAKAADGPFNFSSPKTQKRFVKSKTFSSQGRAAHMIGLVTKVPVIDKDVQSEPEMTIKKQELQKSRWKDVEITLTKGDRQTIAREPERIGSPSGSRQEKIFNNMKAADHASSTPPKLFSNLKNDGEKISPKMDRTQTSETVADGEVTGEDEDGRVTPVSEASELPMLEWSSANPPSLTASPSASILKRSIIDLEPDATMLSKLQRKRVSFADPPVSKEMGYEIETFGSPHKTSKFSGWRNLFDRKNSPTRVKQPRFKMIQIDPEKVDVNEEPQILCSTDIEMDRERDNALLIKIAEDLEESIELQTSDNITKNGDASLSTNKETSKEMEKTDDEKSKETSGNVPLGNLGEKDEKANSTEKNIAVNESQTQDDLFNSSDEKLDSPKGSVSLSLGLTPGEDSTCGENSSLEALRLNVTDDSIIDKVIDKQPEQVNKSDSLDDTMDAADVLSLNCSVHSDEIFRGASTRPRIQASSLTSEMDTLPVTDSILTTQDSQELTQPNIELARPELLNSTDPIYPKLINCQEPIDNIIDNLTNPLWRKNLAKYLQARSIRTVGDLARLSEREIHRIPVKGSSKVDFVRKVLDRYEQSLRKSATKLDDDGELKHLAENVEKERVARIANDMEIDELPSTIRKTLGDISTLRNMSDLPSDCTTFDVSELGLQSTTSSVDRLNPHFRNALERTSTKYSNRTINLDPTICTTLDDTTHLSQISTINISSDLETRMKQTVGQSKHLPEKSTKCVGSQTKLEDLLDEIDIDLILQSAVKRTNADKLLAEYKLKMDTISEEELCKETMTMLGIDNATMLKLACRECGLDKVLQELPDVFKGDEDVYGKILNAYRNKIRANDRIDLLNRDEIKEQFCKNCTSKELLKILGTKLKDDEQKNAKTRIIGESTLNAILRRVPMDLIVKSTIANEEIIPSSIVLNTALNKNDTETVTRKIVAEYPAIANNIFDGRINPEAIVSHIKETPMSREELLSVHEVICAKLSPEDLLNAYHEAMKNKLSRKPGQSSSD